MDSVHVISYWRCSTRKQELGDSQRRQLDAALSYCERHGLTLDQDFMLADRGVSAYSGANLKRGPLYNLVAMCRDGKLRENTILLVEAFDRLTRLPLSEAFELLLSLINNGLTVVTLTDERVWTQERLNNVGDLMSSILTLDRAHQESEAKGKRVRDAYEARRALRSNIPFGSAPGWLHRENKLSPWCVDEVKANSVRRVFELSASGLGSKAIAGIANRENWPVPTRLARTGTRWHAQMPGQILRNRAVLGEHEYRKRSYQAMAEAQHWRGLATDIILPNFYPRIVSDEMWYRAQASISTRGVARRRDTHGLNIWSGLLYCGHCGAPLHRKSESRGQSRASIVCPDRLAGLTECPSSSASYLDAPLLNRVVQQAPSVFGTPQADQALTAIAALEAQESQLQQQLSRIEDFIIKVGGDADSLSVKYLATKDAVARVRAELSVMRSQQVLSAADYVLDEEFLVQALEHLYSTSPESRVVRAELHLKLARLIEHIWLWAYDVAIIQWKVEGWTTILPLRHKALKSRANPESRHHRPVLPRVVPEGGPVYAQISAGDLEFEPPVPQRRNQVAGFSAAASSVTATATATDVAKLMDSLGPN